MRVAIIPARAGSKRLENKNIKSFAGKPLIFWTVKAALESGKFDKVFVSTDSDIIKDIALESGAEVRFLRDMRLASDSATSDDVVTDFVVRYEDLFPDVHIKNIALLQPTSPLRPSRHISEAWDLFVSKKATAVVSVCKLEHPIAYCAPLGANLELTHFNREGVTKRSQELDVYYRLNGAIYIFRRDILHDFTLFYGDSSYGYEMEQRASVDIDNIDDFRYAEFIYSISNEI